MDEQNDKPPLLKSWPQWYLLVICFLAVLIFLFYMLTKTYS